MKLNLKNIKLHLIFLILISFNMEAQVEPIKPVRVRDIQPIKTFDNQNYSQREREKLNVPRGYKEKGDNTFVYGKWFISTENFTSDFCPYPYGYGLDSYFRDKSLDFSFPIQNFTVTFEMYQTSDRKGYWGVSKFAGYCTTIGVYEQGISSLFSSFDYKKEIRSIYEFLYLNN